MSASTSASVCNFFGLPLPFLGAAPLPIPASVSLVTFILGNFLTATMIYFVVVLNFPHQYIVSIE